MFLSQMTDEQLTMNANQIKDVVLEALDQEGLLKKSAEEIGSEYAVVIHRKGFFGRFIDKMLHVQGERLHITVVKMVPIKEKNG